MDVNAAGAAVAAWVDSGVVKTTYRAVGRDWSRPMKIGRVSSADSTYAELHAVIGSEGRAAVVAWDSRNDGVTVFARTKAGRWHRDDQTPVGGACCWTSMPTADMDERGNLVITWVESDDFSGDYAAIAWRRPSGRWSSTRGGGGYIDLVAHDAAATLVRGGDGLDVQTARRGADAQPWVDLRPGSHIAYRPMIAGNAVGDLVIVALEGEEDPSRVLTNEGPGRLVVMSKSAGGRWVDASADAPRRLVGHPAVAIGSDGEIAVTYRRSAGGDVEVVTGRVGETGLSAPVSLADGSAPAPASVAVTGSERIAVTWSAGKAGRVRVARRTSRGDWSSLGRLRGDTVGGHLVRGYPNGMFTVLHLDGGAVWWSDRVDDRRGPRTSLRAPNRKVSATRSIRVRWRMTDALSRPDAADVRVRSERRDGRLGSWSIWKRSVERERVTFRGRPGRRYCFSVRGHDRAGNVGRWSDRRCTRTPRG
jgi:hypothetical protein